MALPTLGTLYFDQLSAAQRAIAYNTIVEQGLNEPDDRPQKLFYKDIAWSKTPADLGLPAGTVPAQYVFAFSPPNARMRRMGPEGRTARPVTQHAITLTAGEPHESTLKIRRVDFEADILGVLRKFPRDLRRVDEKNPDNLLCDLLRNGKTGTDYRGEAFFATSKVCSPEGMVADVFSNLNVGNQLTETNLAASHQQGAAIRSSDGNMLGVDLNTLLIPLGLEHDAMVATLQKSIVWGGGNAAPGQPANTAAQGDNPMATILKYIKRVIVLDVLAAGAAIDDTTWYLEDTTTPVALLHGLFQNTEFTQLFDPRDANVFMKDEYIVGIRKREEVAYGRPQFLQRNES